MLVDSKNNLALHKNIFGIDLEKVNVENDKTIQ